MHESSRRSFLKGPVGLIGLAALVPGRALAAATTATPTRTDDEAASARFLRAVAEGDLAAARGLLDADPGLVHARGEQGRSAFAIASLAGHEQVAELVRQRGYRPDLVEAALVADWERFDALATAAPGLVNQDHPIGGTAMYAAAIGGAGSDIWRVYRYGADPDANPRGADGRTALRAALDHPDLATAEMTAAGLLANGADANAPQAGGSSPLHAAAERGSLELVEMLVRKGARVDALDAEGRTPIELAVRHRRPAVAAMLEAHAKIPRDHSTSRRTYDLAGNPYRRPDLTAYAADSRYRVVGFAHSDLDEVRRRVDANPALAHSVATTTEMAIEAGGHTGRLPIVDYLLDKGAPYSLPTAVMRGDLERARGLLDEDPLRIHERGPHDFALLWYPVIARGRLDLAELLLDRGAAVERQHHLGTTALHWAAMSGQRDMVALLLERGANTKRIGRKFDAAGQTPLQLAEQRGHTELIPLLR